MQNFAQKHEVDYAKEKVRPEVEEEVFAKQKNNLSLN